MIWQIFGHLNENYSSFYDQEAKVALKQNPANRENLGFWYYFLVAVFAYL